MFASTYITKRSPRFALDDQQAKPRKGARYSGFLLATCLLASFPVKAEELNGAQIEQLALRGTWAAEEPGMGYWSWSDDNMVCLRLLAPDSDCEDTGSWSIDGDVMCYELTWWGEAYDLRNNCFTVKASEGERFEAVLYGRTLASTFITFVVLEQ